MLVTAADGTAEDAPAKARSYRKWLVQVPFLDFKWDEGFLDIRANKDRHLFLATSGKGTWRRCGLSPILLRTETCLSGMVRSFTAQAPHTAISLESWSLTDVN